MRVAQHAVHSSVFIVSVFDQGDLKSDAVMCFQGGVCRW